MTAGRGCCASVAANRAAFASGASRNSIAEFNPSNACASSCMTLQNSHIIDCALVPTPQRSSCALDELLHLSRLQNNSIHDEVQVRHRTVTSDNLDSREPNRLHGYGYATARRWSQRLLAAAALLLPIYPTRWPTISFLLGLQLRLCDCIELIWNEQVAH